MACWRLACRSTLSGSAESGSSYSGGLWWEVAPIRSLENRVIRPLGDARVHFALNCMSVSCPRLPQSAFTAQALDQELDVAARECVADKRNLDVDDRLKQVRVSATFKVYTKDFLGKAPSLQSYYQPRSDYAHSGGLPGRLRQI